MRHAVAGSSFPDAPDQPACYAISWNGLKHSLIMRSQGGAVPFALEAVSSNIIPCDPKTSEAKNVATSITFAHNCNMPHWMACPKLKRVLLLFQWNAVKLTLMPSHVWMLKRCSNGLHWKQGWHFKEEDIKTIALGGKMKHCYLSAVFLTGLKASNDLLSWRNYPDTSEFLKSVMAKFIWINRIRLKCK